MTRSMSLQTEISEIFLEATTHLYKRLCPSVGSWLFPSVGRSCVIFRRRKTRFLRSERLQMTNNNNNNDENNDKWVPTKLSHLMYPAVIVQLNSKRITQIWRYQMDMPLDEVIDGHNWCQIVANQLFHVACVGAEYIIRRGASYGHFNYPDFL